MQGDSVIDYSSNEGACTNESANSAKQFVFTVRSSIMHFGLEPYLPYALYLSAIAVFLLSVFWRPLTGVFYLVPLLPLQTIRYRTNDLPLGGSLVGIMLIGVALGLLRQGKSLLPRSTWTRVIAIYALFTYVSLWMGAAYLGQPYPLPGDRRFGNWQEYMVMPAMLLLVAAATPTKRQMKAIVLVMWFSILAADKSFWNTVSDRDFSTYNEELKQEGGTMGYAGTNGLAAFAAQNATFLLAMAGFEKKRWNRYAYYGLAFYSAICLMYSFSRGGYVAFLAGWLFLGLFKQRKLLALLLLFLLTWTALVPPAVQQRVNMTYDSQTGELDHSADTRIVLWNNAMEVFRADPLLGTGFNTYEYMHLNKRTDGVSGYYEDTHNYFVKMLVETGVVGFLLFLGVLGKFFFDGYRLFRHARDPFSASLGLGLMGWLVCAVVASLFGDRWSFLQVNGFLWVIGALVVQADLLERSALATPSPATPPQDLNSIPGERELSRAC
jgi:putative inorganic carbon (HCO3(-)) transporter